MKTRFDGIWRRDTSYLLLLDLFAQMRISIIINGGTIGRHVRVYLTNSLSLFLSPNHRNCRGKCPRAVLDSASINFRVQNAHHRVSLSA